MKTQLTVKYPAAIERAIEMLCNPDYQRTRIDNHGLEQTTAISTATGTGHQIKLSGVFPSHLVPAQAGRFIRGPISFQTEEIWTAQADDTYAGTLTTSFSGIPLVASATMVLRPGSSPQTCSQEIDFDFTVSVPLLGRSLEQKALKYVNVAVQDEENRAAQWLATHQ